MVAGGAEGSTVKRQRIEPEEIDRGPLLASNVPQVDVEWIRAQRAAQDAYLAHYAPQTIRGEVCSSSSSQQRVLSVFELLAARVVGILPVAKDGFLAMLDFATPPTLIWCRSVAIQEELSFHQLVASYHFSSAPLPAPLYLDFASIGSPVLWELIRSNAECQRIFLKNGFVMQTRFFDTRVNAEVIKVTHVPRSIPGLGHEHFIELLKLCGQAHVQESLSASTMLHPRLVMEFFRVEARRLARENVVNTTPAAQESLEKLAEIVHAQPTISQKGFFTQLFQVKRE